jgi:CHC2-type zinc finger protein
MSMAVQAEVLFGRHLDLSPLGRRHRGLVRCRFHADRTASLSIDLDAGVFHCFGCGIAGGVRKFAELVGEATMNSHPRRRDRSPLDEARREIFHEARRQFRRLPLEEYRWADEIRGCYQIVDRARAIATRLGPDDETAWTLLAQAAWLETATWAAEAAA